MQICHKQGFAEDHNTFSYKLIFDNEILKKV